MLLRRLAILVLLSSVPAWATFGAKTAWDVQTTGANTAGGGFDAGVVSPGTDESMGAGTAITVTLTGTTTGTADVTFSATTHGPGNFVHIASGTGCTVGWFEVLSQSSGTATFDRAMGTAANVCVGTIGGSLLTIAQATTNANVNLNTVWIQSGTYTITTAISPTTFIFYHGYATTHGDDGTAPLITTSTNSINGFTLPTTSFVSLNNIRLTSTAGTPGNGMLTGNGGGNVITVIKSTISGWARGIDCNAATQNSCNLAVVNSEIASNTGVGVYLQSNYGTISGSWIHNNGSHGISDLNAHMTIIDSIISANTGSGLSYGNPDVNLTLLNDVFSANGNSGVNSTANGLTNLASSIGPILIQNCVFYGNTGYGINNTGSTAGAWDTWLWRNNAYGGNTTAATVGATELNPVITLTATPFTSTTDFSLNATAGGGALLKATGFPGAMPGGTGYLSVGAIQPNPAGGGGTTATNTGYAQ